MRKFFLLLFLINLSIIIFFWYQGTGSLLGNPILANNILALGTLSGLMAVFFVLLQFVMRGRAIWVEKTFGLNNLATAHRLNGYLSLSFLLLHFSLILTSYSLTAKKNIIEQFFDFILHYDDLLNAFIALCLFITIVFVSIYIVRKKLKYETWYYIHLCTYLAILLAWGHQLKLGEDFINKLFVWYWYALYTIVFGNLFVFRFLRQIYLFLKYRFKVAQVIKETKDTTSVYISANNLSQFSIEPGQFFILRFLDKKRWIEAHPFSLSFVPKNNLLRLTIKNVGDFTSEIAGLKKNTPVLVDGPLGTFTAKSATKNKFLFIAGGVGITPIRSLIEEMVALKKDIIVLYSNKTKDIIFKDELDNLAKKYKFPLYYFVTEDKDFKGQRGRIDAERIKKFAPDFLKRDIFVCGPTVMLNEMVKQLKTLGVKESSLHHEQFSL